ncbi:phosphonate ABC transporter ATP-binding protein [Paenibacillus hunanensis]|uniref:phosphonate ABC transporter ATP-binding protein n=1 Tax=Paenibacillus hunanensis TaxID=539262 RepID=UPI002A69CDEC|nr:phosphonate ABC transporter ATP-binding protein [Paenibacillus hunanensis]WPP43693.1 phosphonate ABC transporter ATP-binding protein [Paenibacillus hunanensis]
MIEFQNVSKVYPNGTRGLNNINLTIGEGELVVIVGLSGAGKSTLLRSINRLNDISEGNIMINGQSITNASGAGLRHIRRGIGMIFQNFNLVKRSTVLRNVLSGRVGHHSTLRTMLGMFPAEDTQLAMDALERVNIRDKAYSRADQLSGGQQQRVSIARALAQEPQIILADEPVASLDPLTTRQVMDDLRRINRDLKITTIINLHFIDLAREYATRIIGLRAGEIVFDGTPEEATDEAFAHIYGRSIHRDEVLGASSPAEEIVTLDGKPVTASVGESS